MEMSKFKSIVLGFWECGGLDVYVHPDPAFHEVYLSAYGSIQMVGSQTQAYTGPACMLCSMLYSITLEPLAVATHR